MHRHNGAVGVESRKRRPPRRAKAPRVEPRQARACRLLPVYLYDPLFPLESWHLPSLEELSADLTYAFSGGNEQAAKSVWTTSLYGTYIITPDHLQGNRPIRFLGVADSNDAPEPVPAPEPIR